MKIFSENDKTTLMTEDNYYLTVDGSGNLVLLDEQHTNDPVLWTVKVVTGGYQFYQTIKKVNYYLDGITSRNELGLAPNPNGIYTGASWTCAQTKSSGGTAGTLVMVCLGAEAGDRVLYACGRSNSFKLVKDIGMILLSYSIQN